MNTRLTAAHLDRREQELQLAGETLPDLLRLTGAMTGPFRRPRKPLSLRNERVFGAALACIALLGLVVSR